MTSLMVWSKAILLTGFLLQCALVWLMLRRRLAAEVWVFTGLLLFYLGRTTVLFVGMGRVPGGIYDGLALVDFMLQMALGGQLLARMSGSFRRRVITGAAVLAAASGVTWGLVAMLPMHSPVPVDRGAVFTGTMFAMLLGVAVRVRLRGWGFVVTVGFGLVGVAGVVSQCGRSVAASHRDGSAFVAYSYMAAAVYVGVLVYWIVYSLRTYGDEKRELVAGMEVQDLTKGDNRRFAKSI